MTIRQYLWQMYDNNYNDYSKTQTATGVDTKKNGNCCKVENLVSAQWIIRKITRPSSWYF